MVALDFKNFYVSNLDSAWTKSQGQLAGFVVDEAHCVRYVLCFVTCMHVCFGYS